MFSKKKWQKVYWKKKGPELRKKNNERRHRMKSVLFSIIGTSCVKCGYDGPALEVDHIHDNGKMMRMYWGNHSKEYRNIIKNTPEWGIKRIYQPLCPTCNKEKVLGL